MNSAGHAEVIQSLATVITLGETMSVGDVTTGWDPGRLQHD